MRLLLIDDDPRYRTLLRHHISCDWPDVDSVSYNPRVRGPLTPGVLAQGYSVVLLDHGWKGASGLDWLRDFQSRDGFAPVIFLAADDESLPSPAWHEQELRKTEDDFKAGHLKVLDWENEKKELRKQFE